VDTIQRLFVSSWCEGRPLDSTHLVHTPSTSCASREHLQFKAGGTAWQIAAGLATR
jgi:hypothetical protein